MSLTMLPQIALRPRRIHVVLNWVKTPTTPQLDLILVLPANNAGVAGSARAIQFADPTDPTDSSAAVRHLGRTDAAVSTDRAQVDLNAVPPRYDQILMALSATGGRVVDAAETRLRLIDAEDNTEILRIDLAPGPADLVHIPGELYRRADGWYYRAVGFGFTDGLTGLSFRFAVPINDILRRQQVPATDVAPDAAEGKEESRPEKAERRASSARAVTPLGDVKLLPGASATIKRPQHEITAELTWRRKDKDLDLYALYIDSDGREGVCYYRDQGSLKRPPHICLTTGDRHRGREAIVIARPSAFRHILICAYSAVENGIGSFRGFRAVVEVDDHAGSVIQTPLYHRNSFSYWVAIARIDLTAEEEAVIEHVETYSRPRSERRPVLRGDGTFVMDAGRVEFKTR
ncbi:Stress protein [Parafrankia sp. Ea1.12]|uniref:TerD family protein n=1 Tax=Parafrankia sp. Ea1.12 TaxID=573499 RepID=UPI000DA53189|nr:TerD family protein [Parafrankia sp. Ea1.12]SQD95807.1 Stress protein [Parafrankia sp. Ea1.12]